MNNATRFWILEARYQKAKRRAEKLIRLSNACTAKADQQLEIMQTVFDEQKIILRKLEEDGLDEVPCDP